MFKFFPVPTLCVRKRFVKTLGLIILLTVLIQAVNAQSTATCSGTPFNYLVPAAPQGTTYMWSAPVIQPTATAITGGSAESNPQSAVSQVLENTTVNPATATYTVTNSSTGTSFLLVVTVNPLPELTSSATPAAVCSGVNFSYSPQSSTPGASFSWSRLAVGGISNVGGTGTGNPAEVLNNTTINPVTTTYTYTVSANNCSRANQDVTVIVNPIPFLTSTLTPSAICGGTTFNYVPTSLNANTYTWVRTPVTGINGNAGGNSAGNPEVHEILSNTSLFSQEVNYTYTLTNNTLACSNNAQVVKVRVDPIPIIGNQTVTSCNGNTFLSSPTNVPNGTLYTWSAPVTINPGASISGGSAVSTGQFYIGEELTNNGASAEVMRYTVSPNTNGCGGSTFFVDVTVNTNAITTGTKAVLSNGNPSGICSGATFSFTPQSNTATSFTWKRFYNTFITQGVSNGTGSVGEQLTNNSTSPTVAYYAYTSTVNGCNNTQQLAVSVNPPTVLSSSLTPVAVCSNTVFNYTPTSATTGTAFGWTRAGITGISNPAQSGSDNPAETLVNTTIAPINVSYSYFLNTANGCNNTQTVVVRVNPTPVLTSTLVPTAICSGGVFSYLPTSSTAGATFSWSRPVTASISNGPGSNSGTSLSETLVNTSVSAVSVTYNYSVSANGCSNPQVVTVSVKPTPRISIQTVESCSAVGFTLPTLDVPTGTTYTWTTPTVTPTGASVSGATSSTVAQTSFNQIVTNQTLNPAYIDYTVAASVNGCTGTPFKVTATVNPVPSIANQSLNAICSGVSFSYSNGNVPTGTTYTWSNPLQTPPSSITGGSAQPIGQSIVSQLLSSTNNQSNTAIYTVTPSAFNCQGNTFTLTVPVNPVPAINNVSDTICSTASFSIAPNPVPANTLYRWSTPTSVPFGAVIGGTQQTLPSSTISQSLVNTTSAKAAVVYTVTPVAGNCSGPSFNVTITVGVPLPFTADQTALICSGTAFDVTPSTLPSGTSFTWGVPVVRPANSIVGATGASTPQGIISQTLDNLINRTDTVVYTILPYNTGCRGNIFTATVRVLPLPKSTITGNPVICRYPYDTLSVSFTGTGPWSFTYLNGTVPGTQTGITTSPYKWVVPSLPDVDSRTVQILTVKDFACANANDGGVFVQRINSLPVGQVTSLHGQYICNNIPDTLLVNSLRVSDILSYQWMRNNAIISNAVKDSLITSQTGRYNVTLTNQYGCVDTASAPGKVDVIAQPVLKISFDSYCIDKLMNFTNLTDTAGIGVTKWLWEFGDTTTSTSFSPSHTYVRAGDHHIRLTATQEYCAGYTTSAEGVITIQSPIAGITMPSLSTYKGKITPLAVRSIPNYRYQWNPSRGLDKPDSASTNFNLSATQQYAVSLISEGGCITTDSLLVRVFDDKLQNIFVPKSFTPNNDGINDKLYPYLSGIKEFKYFKVVNRLGKIIFETKDPDEGWNGSFNGIAQPMGIYLWFSVGTALDGTLIENKGQTLLLR